MSFNVDPCYASWRCLRHHGFEETESCWFLIFGVICLWFGASGERRVLGFWNLGFGRFRVWKV